MRKSAELLAKRDEPVKYDREDFAREFYKLLTTPGYTTNKSRLTTNQEPMATRKKEEPPKALNEEEKALEALAEEITKAFAGCGETFMLASPMALTVKRKDGTYSKQAHIGSEDFHVVRAYMGKKGKFIYVFRPVMIADYVEMEMDETQAQANLVGLREWMGSKLGDIRKRRDELRAELAKTVEAQKLEDRYETYRELGFGSW